MHKSIGYHTRLNSNNNIEITGGSFGGVVDIETIDRLVSSHFKVLIKPSGRAIFIDSKGNEVNLYISVDPETTIKGREALRFYQLQQSNLLKEDKKKEKGIEELLSRYSYEEILRRLSN